MKPPPRPQVLEELFAIFPTLKAWWDAGTTDANEELSYESILADVLLFLSADNGRSFSEGQLRGFSDWVNSNVVQPDELGAAISESFLEPARAIGFLRVLAPFLSPEAMAKSLS